MKYTLRTICVTCATIAVVFTAASFIINPSRLVEADFANRSKELPDSTILNKLNKEYLTQNEKEAFKFLYTYMPTPDLALYDSEMIESSVATALQAMEEMPWGSIVPRREFMHFVLPMRVNNENLDSCRPIFYRELRDRVKHLSMEDAILEVNHWCHEKVTYQPSDGRTSSPLSTVSQAIGRCGEESTFAVAALRSVGIPARQVYTPRWAHTDDNHAWVEAWANGRWHFIGACEPEAVLDLAWFNDPASRALMMTTNVIGNYDGPEEVLSTRPGITTINVTSNYAPVDTLHVQVVDVEGKPTPGASVKFCIYNYAEFFPVTTKVADNEGKTSLLAGIGDVVVWASDGSRFGFAKGTPGDGTLTLTLNHTKSERSSFDMDIVPPKGAKSIISVSEEDHEKNMDRLAYEDSIRRAYTSTFYDEKRAYAFADSLGLERDQIKSILVEARGNGKNIAEYLLSAKSTMPTAQFKIVTELLSVISEKDRRDISLDVIEDNVEDQIDPTDSFQVKYILSPRVESEPLSAYKRFFRENISKDIQNEYRENPEKLVHYIADNIKEDDFNPQWLSMRPVDSYRWKRADIRSRKQLFVAMARSFGIPSRIDPMTGNLQYADAQRKWRDVNFESKSSEVSPKGKLDIEYTPQGRLENPKYYTQFSLFAIHDGFPERLDFDDNDGIQEINKMGIEPDAGDYMLLTGQRQANGSVLVHGEIFPVLKNEIAQVPLSFRSDKDGVSVIGSMNAENLWQPIQSNEVARSILSQTGRGYYILGLIRPNNEPTSHALRDIAALKAEFDKAGVPLMLLFADQSEADRFDFKAYPAMPEKAVFGIDKDSVSLQELAASLNLPDSERPLFVIADTFNRVVFLSQGYTIGLGDQLLNTLSKIDN